MSGQITAIVRQIHRYQEEHGGAGPREHWVDAATWNLLVDEICAVSHKDRSEAIQNGVLVMCIPIKVWDT
jgi:hypothetical protein